HALSGEVERTVDRRKPLRFEHDANATALSDLVRMPEEAEAGHVCDRVRSERPDGVRGVLVQRAHPADRALERLRTRDAALDAAHDQARTEWLREEERVTGARAVLRPDPLWMDRADDGEPVLRLGV